MFYPVYRIQKFRNVNLEGIKMRKLDKNNRIMVCKLLVFVLAFTLLLPGVAKAYTTSYVVDNLSSSNISVIGSPYSMIDAWYKSRNSSPYWMDDVTVNSFATGGDKIVLYFDYPSANCGKAKITSWTWHPHYVALTFSDGTKTLTGRLTVVDNTVVLKLNETEDDVLIVVSIKNAGTDYGGIQVDHLGSGQFHVEEDKNSDYARVGAFIDIQLSDTSYNSRSVDINADPSSSIASQLDGAATDLDNDDTDYTYATFNYGISAVNYNSGWSGDLTLSFSYSATSFADAESMQYSSYTTAQSDARTAWIAYFDKAPHPEPWSGTDMYWKSWAMLGINGDDHTQNMASGKYDFVGTIEYETGDGLGRQIIGHHKNIAAAIPAYPKYWHFDHIWAPPVLVYSDQSDVLKSMFKGNSDIYYTLGDVTDCWMDGKDNRWDNYQNCFYGDMLDTAYYLTGDSCYQDPNIFADIVDQQLTRFRDPNDANQVALFNYPFVMESHEPLSVWRTAPVTSLVQLFSEMDPNYADDYNDLLASLSYFWYTGGSYAEDYYSRYSNGDWSSLGSGMCSNHSLFYVPSLNYGETVLRKQTENYVEAPWIIQELTLNDELIKAAYYRKNVFKVSDYFPEGITSSYGPSGDLCVYHCSYVAHTEILAKLGLIPYVKNGFDGFFVAPDISEVTSVTGIHYPEADTIMHINYNNSGLYADIYEDGSLIANNKRHFIPFTSISGVVVDDMDAVDDWSVGVGSNANGGSISTSSSDKKEGTASGVLNYDHSTAQGFDYVNYTLSTTLDLENNLMDFWLKQANDAHAYLTLKIYDSGSGWAQYTFAEGNDEWTYYSLKNSDFYDWGSGMDYSDVQTILFQSNGDASSTATANHHHVDYIIRPVVLDVYFSDAAVGDMDSVKAWTVSVGGGATSGSITTDPGDKKQGTASGVLNYSHSTATSNDYVYYARNMNALNLKTRPLYFWLKQPNDANAVLELRIYDSDTGYAYYTFPEGNNAWTYYSLTNSNFTDGGGMDYDKVVKVEFRSNGDASATATADHYHVDFVSTPDPIDNMDRVGDWTAGKGSGATSCSMSTDTNDKQEGSASGVLMVTAQHKGLITSTILSKWSSIYKISAWNSG